LFSQKKVKFQFHFIFKDICITKKLVFFPCLYMIILYERGSSGSIVSDYGLDDRAIKVWFSTGAEDFSSNLSVQTGSGAHPASYPFPGGKARPGRDADHSPPSSCEVKYE
jgi:hypothetical protein